MYSQYSLSSKRSTNIYLCIFLLLVVSDLRHLFSVFKIVFCTRLDTLMKINLVYIMIS